MLLKYLTWQTRAKRDNSPALFHRFGRARIGGVLVDRDGSWRHSVQLLQSLPKEALSGDRIPSGAEWEIDRLTPAVDGAVKIGPPAFDLDVRLVHPPWPLSALSKLFGPI